MPPTRLLDPSEQQFNELARLCQEGVELANKFRAERDSERLEVRQLRTQLAVIQNELQHAKLRLSIAGLS